MSIDNIEKILPLISFNTDDDFYYLQVMQRRKEHADLSKNSRVIKNYYIRNLDYLLKRYDTIKDMCDYFGARACLRLNKRSFKKVAFRTMQNIVAQMMQDDFMSARQAFSKACGQCHNDKNKKWIVDIDTHDIMVRDMIIDIINKDCQPEGDKIITVIPSKNGCHLITSPFNMKQFKDIQSGIDVQKDNPTNLYIP